MSEPVYACGPRCWTPIYCTVHHRRFQPVGRSVPLEASDLYCDPFHPCDGISCDSTTRVHLWDEHDSNRSYTDPLGWLNHVKNCEDCS